jgi:hypothetical protein
MITYKRGKGKNNISIGAEDFYKYYLCNRKSNHELLQKEFSDILYEFHDAVTNFCVYDNYILHLPFNLGNIYIVKKKLKIFIDDNGKLVKRAPVNYLATKELWERDEEAKKNKKLIYYLNEMTDGYIMSWKWNKSKVTLVNKGVYIFRPLRQIKRKITEALEKTEYKLNYYLNEF